MTEWFYARDGRQNGPVTFEQLVELARTGGLDAIKDSVWNSSMQGWTPAGQVPGIFAVTSAPAMPVSNAANPYAAPESNWSESFNSTGPALAEIEHGSEQLEPMACISRGYEITRRQFANVFLVGLVYFALVMGLSFIIGIVQQVVLVVSSRDGGAPNDFGTLALLVQGVGQVFQQVLSIFMQLGLVRVGLNFVSGREVSIGMLFGGGSKLLPAIGASILFGIAMIIGLLLLIVPGIYIAMRYGYFLTAMVDRDLGIFEAFEYSSSVTTNNRLNLFLLALLNFLIILAGVLLCGVGLILAAPIVWLGSLVAYRWLQYGPNAAADHPGTQIPMLNSL